MTAHYAWLPFLPLLACAAIALRMHRLAGPSHRVAIAAVGASFTLSVAALLRVAAVGPFVVPLGTWLKSGALVVAAAWQFDGLSVVLLVLVTGVSGLVHVFACRYMEGDPRYDLFFAVLALFTGSMLVLVLSTNLLQVYMVWEIMGLCSYLLIAHAGERPAAAQAATKAFLVNGVADLGLALGIVLAYRTFGTLDLPAILEAAPGKASQTVDLLGWAGLHGPTPTLVLIGILFFCGAMGKSAQVPLHVWLPYAMEAPTPVSALIHAATMVNAGVYLVVRLGPLYQQAPAAMVLVAVVGAITALFAAVVVLTQSDIKRILAYSTISHLGFMMLAAGVGAPLAAIFHLVAHGLYKAFSFLAAGSVVGHLPAAHAPAARAPESLPVRVNPGLLVLALLLALLPPLFLYATPYRHLWTAATGSFARPVFWAVSLVAVFLTARACVGWLVRAHDQPIPSGWEPVRGVYEDRQWLFSPRVLGAGALGAGLLFGGFAWFCSASTALLAPALLPGRAEAGLAVGAFKGLAAGAAAALAGWAAGAVGAVRLRRVGVRPGVAARLAEWKRRLYVHALNAGYLDEAYDRWVVRPCLRWAHRLWTLLEARVFDRGVAQFAELQVSLASWLWRRVDVGGVNRSIDGLASRNVEAAHWLWRTVDVGGIDRTVDRLARQHEAAACWLWETVDVGGLDRTSEAVGRGVARSGLLLRRVEPRLLQYHVLLLIGSLVVVMGLVLWMVH
ncbi:NADH-quinone oxidoreductase subunit 5 family protein [Nitrospira sp. Kam-Ns4a]